MRSAEPKETQKRFFTVQSANKMLPLVRSISCDIVEKCREYDELSGRVDLFQGTRRDAMPQAHREEVEQIERELAKTRDELSNLVEELRRLGVEWKGPDGLVDFPAMLDDREVYLCWKVGEPEVMYWHERDAGFKGRQQLTAEMIAQGSDAR